MSDIQNDWADAIEGEQNRPVQESIVKMVSRLVKDVEARQELLAEAEARVSALKAEIKDLLEKRIPDLMKQAEVNMLSTDTGLKVEIKPYVNVSMNKERKEEAMGWLIANGHGGLVKNEVTVPFAAGLVEAANELVKDLMARGYDAVEHDMTVHPMSLGAWGREMVEQGQLIPDCFTIYSGETAKITEPKRKK